MKSIKQAVCSILITLFFAGSLYAGGQSVDYGWKPKKTIRIIVPTETGSPVDRITRLTAAELRKELGVRFNIVNQPGESGVLGTKAALDAPRDGYTWTAGTASDLATYALLDLMETSIKEDWYIFLTMGNTGLISVNANSKYQSFDQLLADFKAAPRQIGVATAGQFSVGHINMDMIRKYTGIAYRHAVYSDAKSSLDAVSAGEVLVTAQYASEQTDMIKAKKIRPLAVLSDTDITLDGYGVIPSIKRLFRHYSGKIIFKNSH